MPKYLLLNDLHLSDRPPSSCTDSYTDDLFEMLYEITAIAEREDVEAVIQAGDFFHIKTPSRTSHALVMRAIEWMRSLPVPLAVVPGNHDISHDRLDSIDKTQPLGLLYAAGAIRLEGYHESFPGLFGVPWQQSWDNPHARSRALREWTPNPNHLIVTHCPLYPPGQELPWENVVASEFASDMGGQGNVLYGHIHDYHGQYEAGGVTFCNVGALSRGSLHESDLTRKIYVTLFDTETGSFTQLDVPHKPGDQVFRVREKMEIKDAEQKLDEFLESVGQTSLEVASMEQVVAHIQTLDVSDAVKKMAAELIMETT